MNLLFRLAARNVRRNMKSTLLCGISISISAAVLLLAFSISRGIESHIVSRNVKFESGGVSISFDKETGSMRNKHAGDSLLARVTAVLADDPDVVSFAFRIYPSNAFLYYNETSQSARIQGMAESEIPLMAEMLIMKTGDAGSLKDPKSILISNGIADQLGIGAGDFCTLMLQSVDGSVNMDDFVVGGIFNYSSQLNKYRIYMGYEDAGALYNTNLPSAIIVNLKDLDKAGDVKRNILAQLDCGCGDQDGEVECGGIKVSSYEDQMGMAKTVSAFNRYGILSIAFFLILISFVGVWSMQTENINDRSREIGAMLSFGFPKRSVRKLLACESIYISVAFFLPVLAVVLAGVLVINGTGGVWLGDSASFAFGSAIVNPVLALEDILLVFFITLLYPLAATLLSAAAISRLKTIELLNIKN